MPLTPVDIRNVAFSKPSIAKRGYNEEEVDAFLDLVGAELARLIEQSNDLRNLVAQRDRQLRAAAVDNGRDLRDHDAQAAKVLGLAQQIADRLTGDAKEEADGVLRETRMRSEQLLAGARAKADGMVNEARTRAETLLDSARTRAETLELQSREKAASLERAAARQYSEVIGSISQEKSVLESKVDELCTFEREYRTRVRTYLEAQLRELDLRVFVGPASTARKQPDLPLTGVGMTADPAGHRADPAIGRAAADVARLPARNGQLNTKIIHEAGMSEMQWEPAV